MFLCPCGSRYAYADCCQPLHLGQARASSPEALMRSRYSAYALSQTSYLIQTHHRDFLAGLTEAELAASCQQTQWQRLEIISAPPAQGERGEVEFKAWYQNGEQLKAMHERSRFVCEQGDWFYCDGDFITSTKNGRNSLCSCGSGKKYKRCCA